MRFALATIVVAVLQSTLVADDRDWIDLSSTPNARKAWNGFTGDWLATDRVALDSDNPKLLTATKSNGPVLVNGTNERTTVPAILGISVVGLGGSPLGKQAYLALSPLFTKQRRAGNLTTKQHYTDLEVHLEFLIGQKSNSGVKLMGLYEIQIFDSFGARQLTGSDCGGIYPRGEGKPRYHVIDNGVPPAVNSCKPAGEWQSLDIVFRSPRFDSAGQKIENARFVKVVLNETLIHENVDLNYPTGSAWRKSKEVPRGPLLLQGDHGPVAFRNVRIRPAALDNSR